MPRGHSLCIYVRFSGKKRTSLCISRVKRQSLLHPNTAQRSFFFSLKSFYRKSEYMPLGHLIILLKSNQFNMASVSVQRSVRDNFSRRQEKNEHLRFVTLLLWDRHCAALLRYGNSAAITVLMCEQTPYTVWFFVPGRQRNLVWCGHNWNLKRVPGLRVMSFN